MAGVGEARGRGLGRAFTALQRLASLQSNNLQWNIFCVAKLICILQIRAGSKLLALLK